MVWWGCVIRKLLVYENHEKLRGKTLQTNTQSKFEWGLYPNRLIIKNKQPKTNHDCIIYIYYIYIYILSPLFCVMEPIFPTCLFPAFDDLQQLFRTHGIVLLEAFHLSPWQLGKIWTYGDYSLVICCVAIENGTFISVLPIKDCDFP